MTMTPPESETEDPGRIPASRVRKGFLFSGGMALSVGMAALLADWSGSANVSVPAVREIVVEATTGHYARALGIGQGLQQMGVTFDEDISGKVDRIGGIIEERTSAESADAIHANISAGVVAARDGDWTPDLLDGYISSIDRMSVRLGDALSDDDTHEALNWRVGAIVAIFRERGFALEVERDNPVFEEALDWTTRIVGEVDRVAHQWTWTPSSDAGVTPEDASFDPVTLDFEEAPMKYGYLAFSADPPMIGISDHPAWAPDARQRCFGAEQWAAAYGVRSDEGEVLLQVREDFNEQAEAVACGDLEDAPEDLDAVLPVRVHDDGRLDVLHGSKVLASYSAQDVYGAFGMTPPENAPGPEAETWSLIRTQIDRLSQIMRDHGIGAVRSEYLLEDGIAGLQEVVLTDAGGKPLGEAWAGPSDISFPNMVGFDPDQGVTTFPVSGTGNVRDVSEVILSSVAEMVINTAGDPVEAVSMTIKPDEGLSVGVDRRVRSVWTPPVTGDPGSPEEVPEP